MLRTIRKALPAYPTDLHQPGALTQLFAAHRARFGDARMEGDGDGDGGDGDGTDGGDGDGDGAGGDGGDGNDPAALLKAANDESAARRRELKPWKDLAKDFGLTPEQAREVLTKARKAGGAAGADGGKDGDEPVDVEQVRRDAERDATERANQRILRSEVRALAADLFADAADALPKLDLTKYEVGDDGEVDSKAILADLQAVLKTSPHLAKKRGPKPDPSQGKGGGEGEQQLTGRARLAAAYRKK
jgi:hypothetical protein